MTRSMLAALREAMNPRADAGDDEEIPDTETEIDPDGGDEPEARSETMSDKNQPPAANQDAGIPKADHEAAVEKAKADGKAEGTKAANDRMANILASDGIKGNAQRMAAAASLATKSPDMSAEDVVSFTAENVAEGKTMSEGHYEAGKAAGTPAATPQPNGGGERSGKQADLNPTSIYAARNKPAETR